MTETVLINKITLCHKNSTGWVRSTLPDVCKSPVSPAPYTNVAYARDLADGTVSVHSHGGAMNGVKGSRFAVSQGDEPGTGGGVKSGVNLHEATWLSWSPNVFMEGRAVTRLTDKMLLNRANTVSIAGYTTWEPGSNEAKICDIACACWVGMRGSSRAGPYVDKIPGMTRRYSSCFKTGVDAAYPNTKPGVAGNPGLASELGFWDPNNDNNMTALGRPPGGLIGKPAPWYGGGPGYNATGSRWMDATAVDGNGNMTDMWDLKFGDDPDNPPAKDAAYSAIAQQNGATYHGEFHVPEQCDNCEKAEQEWQKQNGLSALGKQLGNALNHTPMVAPLPGPGGIPVY